MVTGVALPIDRGATATQMAQTIFGDGDSITPGVTPSDTGVMFSTGDLRGPTDDNPFQSSQSNSTNTGSSSPKSTARLNAAAGAKTFDMLANIINSTGGRLWIPSINGQPESMGSVVAFCTARQVKRLLGYRVGAA